jgi:hypothetical protein
MADYFYTREVLQSGNFAGSYNIENPERVDEFGNQKHLAYEVEIALGFGGMMYINYNNNPVQVKFEYQEELTPEQKTILDTVVFNHKNNL